MAFQDTRFTLAYGVLAVAIVAAVAFLLLNAKPAVKPEPIDAATSTP